MPERRRVMRDERSVPPLADLRTWMETERQCLSSKTDLAAVARLHLYVVADDPGADSSLPSTLAPQPSILILRLRAPGLRS